VAGADGGPAPARPHHPLRREGSLPSPHPADRLIEHPGERRDPPG